MNKIIKLCNQKKELEKIYESLVRASRKNNHLSAWYGDLLPLTEGFFNINGERANNNIVEKKNIMSSFFNFQRNASCTNWHQDTDGHYSPSMLIAAYPNPTEILIPKSDEAKNLGVIGGVFINCDEETYQKVYDLIKEGGHFDVFTPEVGDIYYLGPNMLHRTNPKAIGTPHLVMRIWSCEDYEHLMQ